MNIRGKKVTLRAPEPSDIAQLHEWSNDPELWANLVGWHFAYNRASTERWVENWSSEPHAGKVYCIEAPEHGLIGTASLVDIDWRNRNAFHGMMLGGKQLRGQGFGIDSVFALMRYAFDELGLHRLDGEMVSRNQRSIDFYTESCGWEIEGRKRHWFYRDGGWCDKVIVGITSARYREHCDRTGYWSA